jgi:predicted nucleotidyltransferase
MDSHREAFEEYAEEVSSLETVERVVLFGSVARGEHGVNSDVDVLVEVQNLDEREEIEEKAFELTSKTGISISPIIVEKQEEIGIKETVEKEGIEYVRS